MLEGGGDKLQQKTLCHIKRERGRRGEVRVILRFGNLEAGNMVKKGKRRFLERGYFKGKMDSDRRDLVGVLGKKKLNGKKQRRRVR